MCAYVCARGDDKMDVGGCGWGCEEGTGECCDGGAGAGFGDEVGWTIFLMGSLRR